MRRFAAQLILSAFLAGCASGAHLRGGIDGKDLVKAARKQIGVPYRFASDSPDKGFDCSGLVHYCFASLGVSVPRTTAVLFKSGHAVPKGKLSQGDLVFFDMLGDGPSHVGIYSGGDKMVHAPTTGKKVREEKIGVPYWIKRFQGARRLD